MEHFLGILGLTCVATITLALILRYPQLRCVLGVAFVVRAGAAIFHYFVAPLPDGTMDALRFEREAWEYAQLGLLDLAAAFPGRNQNLYPWTVAWLYALTDRSLLLAQSLSVLAGVGSVFLTWKLAKELWDDRAGIKAAWVAALVPTLILYSVLTLREALIAFFFVMGLLGVARWYRQGGLKPLLLVMPGFLVAASLHGAMFVAILAFLGLACIKYGQVWLAALGRLRLRLLPTAMILGILAFGWWFVSGGFSIPYLGTFSAMTDFNNLLRYTYFTDIFDAGSRYPAMAMPTSAHEFLWKGPVRVVYFVFSPFPWDIRLPRHLIGFVDGLLYLGLAVLIWRNRLAVWNDPAARAVLLIILALAVVYAFGTGNFGTGIRHRMKFVCGMIVLAAPMLPYLIMRSRTVSEPDAKG